MRKQLIIVTALVIIGVAAVLSFSEKKSKASQSVSPKCSNNCTKAKKTVPASTGFFIMDSYQGVL